MCGIWWWRWRQGGFECKVGAVVEHEVEGILDVKSEGCD